VAVSGVVPSSIIAAKLLNAKRKGLLESPSPEAGDTTVAKSVSGPGEAAPVIQHLDLRSQD